MQLLLLPKIASVYIKGGMPAKALLPAFGRAGSGVVDGSSALTCTITALPSCEVTDPSNLN